ncbi:TasA anchoring/assembly protein [Scopulibacillus darangshiensis]|uniref:TasA anchoring/assembly protein n=1 Tax=Scopulibacillus darangshiensis TaxID=442528 RepID=A0A4R2P5Z9_9BACL|nr:amyloid fiber anchoring/assembly protein TapA [Scopulibacillus darangshiensis]TCP30243.1 TasA anchoring/assembly protein [Scopulibacillus darangshiensis]
MGGGVIIRLTRLRRYRKQHWAYILSMQIGLIFLGMVVGGMTLTSPTNAYFNDSEKVAMTIPVGSWDTGEDDKWDKSSLKFISQKGTCDELAAIIQNGKDAKAMKGPVKYEVYWISKGNPKNGSNLASGQIPALQSGGKHTLTYKPEKSGNYMFKAYQRPDHPGKGELWSEAITISCKAPAETEKEKSGKQQEEAKSNDSKKAKAAENNVKSESNKSRSAPDKTQTAEKSSDEKQVTESKDGSGDKNQEVKKLNKEEQSKAPEGEVKQDDNQSIQQDTTKK